jgi:hypothetical protein
VVQSEDAEKSCKKCDKKKRKRGWCQGWGNYKLDKWQLHHGDELCLVCWKRILRKTPETHENGSLIFGHWKPQIERAAEFVPVWFKGVWL